MNIENKIKQIRKNNKLTQKEFAKEIDVSEISVRKYEAGERNPSVGVLIKIANKFNVPLGELSENIDIDDFKKIKDMLLRKKSSFRVDNVDNNFILQRIDDLQNKISDTGTYTGSDIEILLNEISFILKRKNARTSLNMLKDYISSKDYDINKLSDESLIEIDKKCSDILELEFFKLNK